VSSGGGAPTATTAAATGIDAQSETLNGSVVPSGLPTAMWFEWGATTNYGNVTAATTANFVHATAISTNITGLTPGAMYHYRVWASNSAGVSTGLDVSFTTLGGVPSVSTLSAVNVDPTNATLAGQANPNYVTTIVWFAWGATTNLGTVTAAQEIGNGAATVAFSNRISNLVSAATYYYRAYASNQFGVATGSLFSVQAADTNVLIDATTPGASVTPTSANSPVGQEASKAIDNVAATKYLNLDELDTGFDVTVFDTSRVVRSVTLISAEDAPERDPSSFTLWGSPDGTNFTLIASNAVPGFAGRNTLQSFPITNAAAYPVYRVRFPTVSNAPAANSMQIGEVELLTLPEITSPNDTLGGVFGGFLVTFPNELVDRDLASSGKFIITGNTAVAQVNIIPAAGRSVLKALELIGAHDDATYPNRHSTNFTVYGSDDGFTFFPLGEFTSSVPTVNQRIEEFTLFGNTTPYYRYRVTFGLQPSGNDWQLGELRLYGDVLAPMSSWRYDQFGTTNDTGDFADQADPDGDGHRNLIEYATGADPEVSNEVSLLDLAWTNGIAVLFGRNSAATDVTIYVEGAHALSNDAAWVGLATNRNGSWGGATNVVEGGGNPAPVQVRGHGSGTSEFHRLRVTHP
jgi:hypothetical protein